MEHFQLQSGEPVSKVKDVDSVREALEQIYEIAREVHPISYGESADALLTARVYTTTLLNIADIAEQALKEN